MKKNILFLLFVFCVSGLFAKDERLYQKETRSSTLELYFSKEYNDYYITDYEIDLDNETYHLNIINSKNEENIKKFLMYLLEHNLKGLYHQSITYYEVMYEELTEKNKEIKIKDNKIIEWREYELK